MPPKKQEGNIEPAKKGQSRWKHRQGHERTATEHRVIKGRYKKSSDYHANIVSQIEDVESRIQQINQLPFRQQIGRSRELGMLNLRLSKLKPLLTGARHIKQFWDDRYEEVGGDMYVPPPEPDWGNFFGGPPPPPPPAGGAGGGIAV